MKGHIGIVQIEHPGGTEADEAAGGYWEVGRGAQLLAMYGELLGMQHINIGYHKLVYTDGRIPEIGFEHARGNATPEWKNPDRPQQVHLDIEVVRPDHLVFCDPAGHPFCLGTDYHPDAFGTGQLDYCSRLAEHSTETAP